MPTIEDIRRQAGEPAPVASVSRLPDFRLEAECTPLVMGAILRVATLAHWIDDFPDQVDLSAGRTEFTLHRESDGVWHIAGSVHELAGKLDRQELSQRNVRVEWAAIGKAVGLQSPQAARILVDMGWWGHDDGSFDLSTIGTMIPFIVRTIPRHTMYMSISLGRQLPRLLYPNSSLTPFQLQKFAGAWLKAIDIFNIDSSSVGFVKSGNGPLHRLVRENENDFVAALIAFEGPTLATYQAMGKPGALEIAVSKGNVELVGILLGQGIGITHHGHTVEAVFESATQNRIEVCKQMFDLLVSAGLDLTEPLPSFRTAMDAAHEVFMEDPGDTELVRTLSDIAHRVDSARIDKRSAATVASETASP